ncbi:MAG: MFS transporter, partial [Christensenella sp.]
KYNLIVFLAYTLIFPLCSYISKKYSVTMVFRISIGFQILYFASIILSGDNASKYIYLFGILSGLSAAANANSMNQLTVQLTKPENRSMFFSISGTLNSIAAMVSPLISGMLITLFNELLGYYVVFGISMILYTIAFFISGWFDAKTPNRESHFFKQLFLRNKTLAFINLGQFTVGMRDGIFGFLINILVFDVVKTENIFGAATSFSKFIVVIFYFLGSKYIRKSNLFAHLKYSMWIMFAAPIPLFLLANEYGVILQMILDSIASPLVATTLNSISYNKIESEAKNDNLEECLAVKEVWLNAGKVVGIGGFMLLYPFLSSKYIFAIILVTNLCYVLSYYIYKFMESKKYNKNYR